MPSEMSQTETGSELFYSQVAIHRLQLTPRIGTDLGEEALSVESNSPRGGGLRIVNSLIYSWRNKHLSDKAEGFDQCTTVYTIVSVALLNQNVSLGFMILTARGSSSNPLVQ